jgi:hypothetical protein
MADKKISALTSATTPLDGTEVLPIVQSGATVKVANNDLRPKQIQSNATTGVLQITGPLASTTRVMTTPNANFTIARTDAAQSFTGNQTFNGNVVFSNDLGNMAVVGGNSSYISDGGSFSFTYTLDSSRASSIYLAEVWVATTQRFNAPGFATATRKYTFAIKREGSTITASSINTDSNYTFDTSNVNYTITLTPSISVLSSTQASFIVTETSGGLLSLGGVWYVAQSRILGELPVTN